MNNYQNQSFIMKDALLQFDSLKSVLLCRSNENDKKLWIKKLNDIHYISAITEDDGRYYLSCESGEINGQFIAVKKTTGKTDWFIPGKSFLHLIYKGYMYLIFPDDKSRFYLIKVRLKDGKSLWHHTIENDLNEYVFSNGKIRLTYASGKTELLSIRTGRPDFS